MLSVAEEKGLNWISEQADTRIKIVQTWANINSGTRNIPGIQEVTRHILDFAAPLDAEVSLIDLQPQTIITDRGDAVEQPLAPCVRLVKRPTANRRVLLTGHLDTVFPSESPFQECADIGLTASGEKLLGGPGVADMKGGILVMLDALMAFEQFGDRNSLGWEVILNSEEEVGSPGSATVLAEAATRAHVGMVFEPALADGTLAGARKGSGNFSLVVKGKAAHAGREHDKGRNAVVYLSRLLVTLDSLNGQREGVTVNVGKFSGGGPVNIVPDKAMATFNIRVPDEPAMLWAQHALDHIIEDYSQQPDYSVDLHGSFGRSPKPMTPDLQRLFDVLAMCGEQLGFAIHHKPTGGCCDGNNLAAAGLPNIDTLGVRGANIHSEHEYMVVDSLAERTKLSYLLLNKLASGVWDT